MRKPHLSGAKSCLSAKGRCKSCVLSRRNAVFKGCTRERQRGTGRHSEGDTHKRWYWVERANGTSKGETYMEMLTFPLSLSLSLSLSCLFLPLCLCVSSSLSFPISMSLSLATLALLHLCVSLFPPPHNSASLNSFLLHRVIPGDLWSAMAPYRASCPGETFPVPNQTDPVSTPTSANSLSGSRTPFSRTHEASQDPAFWCAPPTAVITPAGTMTLPPYPFLLEDVGVVNLSNPSPSLLESGPPSLALG